MFSRLGPWCHDRRRLVLGLWIAALFISNGIASAVGDDYRQDFTLPGAESTEGFDLLDADFEGQGAGQTGTIVFQAEQGVDDPEVQAAMEALFDDVATIAGVSRVESPYDSDSGLISEDGTIAYANVEFPEDVDFADAADVRVAVLDDVPDIDGLRVELGGFIFAEFEEPNSEAIGLAFAVIILIVAFGSVLAMGLPVAVALIGIGIGGAGVILFSNVIEVPEFAPFIGIMIGLGVGIDYALLIITRHREQLHAGHTVRESVAIAMDTAGRAVLFAGATVVVSVLGMLLMGIGFVQGLAVTASVTVALTVFASLTLLPAFLGFAGENIEKTKRRGLIAATARGRRAGGLRARRRPPDGGVPRRARRHHPRVLRPGAAASRWRTGRPSPDGRPSPTGGAGSSSTGRGPSPSPAPPSCSSSPLPLLSLRLAFSDESNFAEDTTTRQAYDLLVEGFGEGFNGPLFLVAEVDPGADLAALAAVNEAVAADPTVATVLGPQPNEDGTAVRWFVAPTDGPQEEATEALVHRLRDDVIPADRGGHRRRHQGDRHRGRQHRRVVAHGRAHPDLLRRRADPVVPAADGGVPVAAGAAQGGDHEPADDRRRLRDHGRPLPVGLGERPHRRAARARSSRGCR